MSQRQAYLLLALAALFWAANPALGRFLVGSVPPISLSFWRWSGAVIVMAPLALPALWKQRATLRQDWLAVLVLGFLSVTGFTTLVYVGLRYTTATNLSLLNATMPVMILIVARLLLGHVIGRQRLMGVAVCLAGVVLIVGQGSLETLLAVRFNPGDPIILAAMLCWASYSVLLARLKPRLPMLPFQLAAFVAGWFFLGLGFAWEAAAGAAWWPSPAAVGWVPLVSLVFLAVFPSVLAFLFWQKGIEATSPGTAGYFIYLVPVFGTLLAVLTLGERLYWFHFAGMAAIFAGIWLAQRTTAKTG